MKLFKYVILNILPVVTLSVVLFFGLSSTVSAKIGVGMGAGEIRITEPVKPGGIYTLPSLRIFNTGDEVTTYDLGISYHIEHPELRPTKEWFIFKPAIFTLEAGKSQEVSITMIVPVKAEPGSYFAFIESGPVASNKPGTSVGVAVATKLFFAVIPANIFQAFIYRVSSFFNTYSPWSWVGFILGLCVTIFVFFKKFFSFSFAVQKK